MTTIQYENETIKNLNTPIPSNLRISTHTATCKISSEILLPIVAEKLEIDTEIIYIEYADHVPKGVNIKQISKKAKEKKKVFYNQITVIVQPFKNRYNNVKLFNNGAVSMTGLKNFDEGEKSIKILIDKISKLKGFVFTSISDKLVKYKEQNILPTLENEKKILNTISKFDLNSIPCSSCNKTFNHNVVKILSCDCVYCNNCIKDQKFKTNSNCCKNCDSEIEKSALIDKNCKINDYKIVLINSDYFVGFEIRRDELHKILIDKYGIYSSYEPCIYPGVNSKYYWNKDYKDSKFQGKCFCTENCSGKGNGEGNGKCKKITISIFQSGSVIITGARNMEQIVDAYNFINKVFEENYDSIKKVIPHFLEKEESKPSQSSKKKTIKIKISNIKNYPNEDMINELVNMLAQN
tara:strand:+ start:399 stop:1622 length:1224 start_codon:yes stop_codon:yes gene_type:complete